MKYGKLLILCVICAAVISCGVKERGSNGEPTKAVVGGGQLPPGVFTTNDKKFLVHASKTEFSVEQSTVIYQVTTNALTSLGESTHLEIQYWMPTMPAMTIVPPIIETIGTGKIKVTYDISMEGLWEFTLKIVKDGTVEDAFVYSYEVPPLE